ncbi:hypothetical protein PCARR_a2516 [Pseudoalteromonas carrageenovora IAM 12662]|uniref:Gamma-glutamylcyclotransferase n=1 Tax=Pseudoalteromonas carrageenovora IAM 12662 TaxID=1314868 RepID=A0ABR9EJU4_PSEVC|nr:hypothetical protein [Pseudoalteromonas carrageenovora IAM 12662]
MSKLYVYGNLSQSLRFAVGAQLAGATRIARKWFWVDT